ncbi:MAG: dephospho-CoA kinase [Candidatus Omnitrophota bacterium]|nr:dephospho-CoA kinase [Candidatus Omnitrophota bacterium]
MIIIGLTGSFGTGKTTVAALFKSRGAKVVDADELAHSAIKKGTPAYKRIIAAFGKSILTEKGDIDRPKLGEMVFLKKDRVDKLNKIIHPQVIRRMKDKIARLGKNDVAVIDAPLLIEANLGNIVDILVVVKASRKAQVERCAKKFSIARTEITRRINSQLPMNKKIKLADFVIDNNGAIAETKKQVMRIWGEIWR